MKTTYGSGGPNDDGSVHYPNFGMALYNRYNDAGINGLNGDRLMAPPEEGVEKGEQFRGWQVFVAKYLRP
jgi:hypothetical protein